jgi:chromosome segregation ATPase
MKLQDLTYKYINVYNKMGNEDLNSLLTKSFSEGILKLQNKISQMNNVQKYNLDSESDIKIHELIADLLKVINNEFVIIYEKIFESNGYYNESNRKVEQLKSEINNNNHNIEAQKKNIEYLNVQLNDQILENNKLKELNDKANEKNSNIYKEIDKLKRQIRFLTKEKGNIISVSQILIRICNVTDSKLSKLIQEGISLCETIIKLEEEKSQIEDKLELLKSNEQNINMLNENKELAMMVNKEQATLLQLQNEFDRKIEEKEKKLEEIKTELNSLYNSYFSYSIDKNISPIPEKSIKTVSNSDLNSNYINSTPNNININLEKDVHQSHLTNYDNFNDNDLKFSNTDNKNTFIKYNSFKQNNYHSYNNPIINNNKNNGSNIMNYQSNNMNGKYNFQYGPGTNSGY